VKWGPAAAGLGVVWLLAGRGWALAMLVAVLAALWLSRGDTRTERRRRPWTRVERRIALRRDGYRCRACGSPDDLELDHIVPFSRGGPCHLSNVQILCSDCNKRKGAREYP
jgi:hypothetical protein